MPHRAGEKMYVDHAGPTVSIVDPETGQLRAASVFVAVLGASSYTYAEATWTRDLYDWIGSHVRALEQPGTGPKTSVVNDGLDNRAILIRGSIKRYLVNC